MAAGLIGATPPLRLGGGNEDRDPQYARSSWRAVRKTGELIKLTVGRDLSGYFERTSTFTRSFSTITPACFFLERIGDQEIVGEEFVQGQSLDDLLASGLSPPAQLGNVVAQLGEALRSKQRPSTETALLAEWDSFQTSVLSLSCWQITDRRFLESEIFAPLRAAILGTAPQIGLVHGDFAGRNILVGSSGRTVLIDAEFAAETHFVFADAARFYALTPRATLVEPQIASVLPRPDAASFLLFWLEQVYREARFNRAEYVSRWLPTRLAEIRRLATELRAGFNGGRLSVAVGYESSADEAAPSIGETPVGRVIDFVVEDARWLTDSPHALRLAGWCHALNSAHSLAAIELVANALVMASTAPLPRPDVRDHFATERALGSGFELLAPPIDPQAEITLQAVLDSGERLPFWHTRVAELPGRGPILCGYTAWAELFDPNPAGQPSSVQGKLLLSILLPVFNTDAAMLRACVDSVRQQHYANWELVIVDDASTASHIPGLLSEFTSGEPRIRVTSRPTNRGIARATNDALELARGGFVIFIDHDDVLRPHALAEISRTLEADTTLDGVYSDEDKIDVTGRRVHPMFKPAFSPEYLRGVMYIGHVLCVRTALARRVGGFDSAFDGVQDYDFMLRVSEVSSRIGHIPRVLYHWRQSPGSSALHGNVKGDMDRKQQLAIDAHAQRTRQFRHAIALGGHRLQLAAAKDFTPNIAVVRYGENDNPLEALRSSAQSASADLLLLLRDATFAPSPEEQRELAALAQLSDSGLIAPMLVDAIGRVAESGRIRTREGFRPAMRGFDAYGDGYNGSLLCNREVSGVAPTCVMIRRKIIVDQAASATSWDELCTQLLDKGLFHRVCAAVRVGITELPNVSLEGAASSAPGLFTATTERRPPSEEQLFDPFYNPHFDAPGRDFWLTRRPNHLVRAGNPIIGRLETDLSGTANGGGVSVFGWAFHLDRRPLTIRISAGPIELSALASELRCDVREVYPILTDGRCGFSARLRLPKGVHRLSVEALSETGDRYLLGEQLIRVSRSSAFSRYRHGSPAELLRFQLFSGLSQPPLAIVPETFPRHARSRSVQLSIVTPSFQQAAFLPKTIDSVLRQNAACDYVVQDGGSTDGSIDVIDRRASQLHAWTSEPDNGQADAIAKGFAQTRGRPEDVMAWINSDDFYLPGTLGYVADYFAQHPDVDMIYGHRVLVDENSQEIGRWFLPPHDDEVLRLNDFVPQETMFWRRRIWDKVGGIDPSFKFAMDWDLLLRFQAAGAKIVRVPYFLACFRIHSAQKTSAQMESVGQKEIDALRLRTFGRVISPEEIENHPRLIRYLRKSAWIEFLWRRFRIRHP